MNNPPPFSWLRIATLTLAALGFSGSVANRLHAQSTPAAPKTFHACYVPATGTVYRIKEPGLPTECGSSRKDGPHVEFSWTDGMRYTTVPANGQVLAWDATNNLWVPTTPAAGVADHGQLTGLADDDHPQYLLGDGVRNTTNGFAVTGTYNTGSIPANGAGVRLMWYPGKIALRAGIVSGSQWDDGNVGVASAAMGYNTTASGSRSMALGNNTTASGQASAAIGDGSTASGISSMALGRNTTASGSSSTALGSSTIASGEYSTAMGTGTTASGNIATALGATTTASGDFSTALGSYASTNGHSGAFVYGDISTLRDGTRAVVNATRGDQFVVRAAGGTIFYSNAGTTAGVSLAPGAGAWSTLSDVNRKEHFRDVDGQGVLEKIAAMPIREWSYTSQDASIRHLGPTAQDFRAAFGLGESETTISTVDADGVSLLAVQALERRTRDLQQENAGLRGRVAELERRLGRLETALQSKP